MSKGAKLIIGFFLVFSLLAGGWYFLIRKEEAGLVEKDQEVEKEKESLEKEKVEEVRTETIKEEKEHYSLDISYPVAGHSTIDDNIYSFIDAQRNQFVAEVDEFFGGEQPPGGFPGYKFELIITYDKIGFFFIIFCLLGR